MNCIKNNRVKPGTWDNIENHKLYAEWLGKILEYKEMDDWYKLNGKLISKNHGTGLIKYYNGSPSLFLKSVYSSHEWYEWKFTQTSHSFWKNKQNHKLYAEWLGKILEYKEMDDWYKLNNNLISNNYGMGLLTRYYNGSPILFLKSVFPEYEWVGWKFKVSPYNFWNLETEKQYAIWLGQTIGYEKIEDWYSISRELIIDNFGGGYILKKYNGSPSLFIKTVLSEYNWLDWKFNTTPLHFWKNEKNHKLYADWLGETIGYKNMEDWYEITVSIIKQNFGGGLIINYYNGSPYLFLKSVFPDYKWNKSKFYKKYSYGQLEWLDYIKVSTPDIHHVCSNENGEFKIPNSSYYADGYSESQNCVYEYHGDFWHGNPEIYNQEDINPISKKSYGELYDKTTKKKNFCEESGFKYKFIWESKWLRGKHAITTIQKIYKNYFNKRHME